MCAAGISPSRVALASSAAMMYRRRATKFRWPERSLSRTGHAAAPAFVAVLRRLLPGHRYPASLLAGLAGKPRPDRRRDRDGPVGVALGPDRDHSRGRSRGGQDGEQEGGADRAQRVVAGGLADVSA